MKTFVHSLYQSLLSKDLSTSGWLDGFSLIALLQKANGKSSSKKDPRRGSPLASLGLHLPQVELLESRITPATLPTASLLSQENNLVIVTQDLVDRVPRQELANAFVVTLDPAKDVIHQISSELASRSGLETLRIITHGEAGVLHFGNQVVDQGVLAARAGEIASWGGALAPEADLLLYGCDVAGSDAGREFVITLAGLTGADVAASADATGAGGNTVLEFAAGGVVDARLRASAGEWEAADLQLPQSGDFYYTSSGSAITITNYTGAGGAVTIPTTIIGLPVTTIGTNAIKSNSTITSVTIPNSVTSIGSYAFYNCTGLTSISVNPSNPNYSSADGIVYNKDQTTLIKFPSGKTGDVTIPNSVTSIGDFAFVGCSGLTAVTIPNSVSSIGDHAFYGCTSLTSLTITAGVSSIGYGAFRDCTGLTSITIPNSVSSIGDYAFSDCTGLTSITIPNSVSSIGDNAFRDCTGLTSITITAGVTSIGGAAFSNCTGLTVVTIPNSVSSIGGGAFAGCTGLTSVTIPNSVSSIGDYAFRDCTGLTVVTIPNSVSSIGYGTFYSCTSLTSVNIPNSVTSIGNFAFYNCSGLTSINIPNSVTSIGYDAFAGCTSLTSITIPNSVSAIGINAFYYCTSLTSLTISAGVSSIGYGAFRDCTGLTSLYFLGNAPSLGGFAFDEVPGTVYYLSGKTGWTNPFGGLPSQLFTLAPTNIFLSSATIPENSPSGTTVATLTSASVVAGDGFTYTLVAGAGSGDNAAFTIAGASLKLALVPDFETKSSYSVRIRSADASNVAFEKQFTIAITNVNDAPVANAQTITPIEDTPFNGTLTGSDIEGNTLTFSVVNQGSKGTVVITNTETGAFTYTPNANATGTDSLTFKVNDGELDSAPATVTMNITAVNDAPINEAIPEINGPTRMAGVLTVSSGTWNDVVDGNPGFDFSYQWFRLGDKQGTSEELISGATGSEYTVQTPDLGKYLRVRVTAADRGVPGTISVSALSSIIRIPGVKPLATGSGALVHGTNQGDSPTPSAPVTPFPGFTGEVHISTLKVNEGEIQDTELVIGAGEGGGPHVKIISVNDHQENDSFMAYAEVFRGGVFVSVGDVTGDGLADIVTSAGPGGGPHVKVFDRATMTEVVSFFAYAVEFRGGATVAVVDVDLDGVGEIVTGAGPGGGSHVKVFKLSDGAIVLHNQFFAFDPMLQNGIHVSGGDIDGDGRVELVVGLGEGVGPLVGVYDANSTQQIDLFFAYSQDFTGGTRVSVSDGDGDGIADLITGAGPGGSAHVKVFKNIRDGRTLFREFIANAGSNGVVLSQ